MAYRSVDKGDRVSEYTLIQKIGEGGFGAVWKAEHTQISGKFAAVKIPTSPDSMDMIKTEATFQHQLNHPNIVRTIGLNTEHNPPYFIMEYVEGRNLRKLMSEDGILPPPYAIDIAVQVLEALSFAHSHDIVHKDVKPENILVEKKRIKVTDKGNALLHEVKLTDFGFGKLPDNTHKTDMVVSEFSRTTGVRILSGTLFYAAPEQMVPGRSCDSRADLYSIGVVLYEMLTGELPLGMDMPSELNPVVTPELDRITKKSLSIDRDSRYSNAREMIADLQRAKESFLLHMISRPEPAPPRRTPVPAPEATPPTFPSVLRRKLGRSWTAVFEWALLFFVVGLLGVSVYAFAKLHKAAKENPPVVAKDVDGILRIATSDGPADVWLDGKKVGATPFDVQNMSYESHEITLKRRFYEDRVFHLNPILKKDGRAWFGIEDTGHGRKHYERDATKGLVLEGLTLKRQRGKVVVDVVNLRGVPVYIGSDVVGRTPCELEINAGEHVVRLEMTGFQTFEKQITVAGGSTLELNQLKMKSAGASSSEEDMMVTLEFKTNPAGARVFIGEEDKGLTPVSVTLPPGNYSVKFEKKYFHPQVEQVSISLGQSGYESQLKRIRTIVAFESNPPGAEVFVDGLSQGTTPIAAEVAAGKHNVKFVLAGHYEKAKTFEVEDKEPLKIASDLKVVPPGTLTITSLVKGIEFFLDEKSVGNELKNMRLKEGTYTLRALGMERKVVITAGVYTKIDIKPKDLGMSFVEAGEFIFGSRKRLPAELKEQKARIDKAYFIDIHEVTNGQYARFLAHIRKTGDHSRCLKGEPKTDHTPKYWTNDKYNKPNQPVVGVSFHDAHAYAAWIGKRLPTEQEWEKAARGTKGNDFPWGSKWDAKALNARHQGFGSDRAMDVGSFPSGMSPYGCMDMAGNVAEWTATQFEERPAHVIRGGDFLRTRDYTTTYNRDWEHLPHRTFTLGFRCVMDAKK